MHGEKITAKAMFELLLVRRPILSVSRRNERGHKLCKNGREIPLHKYNGVYHVNATALSELCPLDDPRNDNAPPAEAVGWGGGVGWGGVGGGVGWGGVGWGGWGGVGWGGGGGGGGVGGGGGGGGGGWGGGGGGGRRRMCHGHEGLPSHSVSHLPFRAWCSDCVKELARDWPHRSEYGPPPDIPMVAMDFCSANTESHDEVLTILAIKEKPFQSFGATVPPDKSASEFAVATIIGYQDIWGHQVCSRAEHEENR